MRVSGIILMLSIMVSQTAMADSVDFKWIKEIRCEEVRPYSDGLCAFRENGKWGFMDTAGKTVLSPVYDECYDFTDGHAVVRKDGFWGIIDAEGESTTGFVFTLMRDFSDGLAYAEGGNISYYVSPEGKSYRLSPKFEYGDFSEGYAPVKKKKKKNGKWGYIDKKGAVVIEPAYDTVNNFSNGVALVCKKQDYFYINRRGSKRNIVGAANAEPLKFVNGFAKVRTPYGVRYMDSNFELTPFTVTDATDFNEDGIAAILMQDGSMRYINTYGKSVITLEYDKAGNFSEDYAWVSVDGKYGYIDKSGELVIDTLFTSATDFHDGIAFVSYHDRLGIIKIREKGDIIPQLVIRDIAVNDANGNRKVEAEEEFRIAVTLQNPTGEDIRDVDFRFAGEQAQSDWFSYPVQSVFLPEIKANSDTTLIFDGAAKLSLVSDRINLEFMGAASNLKDPVISQYSFDALGVNACKPIITRYWVYKDNHTPLAAGDAVNLMLTVENDGSDLAKDVVVDLQWPEGISGMDSELRIPLIKPGESTEVTSKFVIDRNAADSLSSDPDDVLTVVASLSEYTKKHRDVKYLSFYTGRMNAQVNLENGSQSMLYRYPAEMEYAGNARMPLAPKVVSATADAGTQEVEKQTVVSELLEGLTPAADPDPHKFALVIGNEDYNSYKQNTTYEVNVDYAGRDADVFAAYATDYMGVPEENVILLHNATYAQMNFNINKLIRMSRLNPGEIELYLFYAGHGQHDADSEETYLIPVDVSISSPTAGLKLEKLYADLGSSRARKTYVFMDACYSGVGRGIVIKPKETPVNGNIVVFTSTSSTQRSMPYKEKQHGMFTYYLLDNIRKHGGKVSVGTLYEDTRREVVKNSIWINNSEQTPELLSGEGIEAGWRDWTL